jgi:hypothetical protein
MTKKKKKKVTGTLTKQYVTQKMFDDIDEDTQKTVRIVPEDKAFEYYDASSLLMVPTYNRAQRRSLLRVLRHAPGKIKLRAIKDKTKKRRK